MDVNKILRSNYKISCYEEDEFLDDFVRFKYIKKVITRYLQTGDVNGRLLINYVILLTNVFGVPCTVISLIDKTPETYFPALKAIFETLNYLSPKIYEYISQYNEIDFTKIETDKKLKDFLVKL